MVWCTKRTHFERLQIFLRLKWDSSGNASLIYSHMTSSHGRSSKFINKSVLDIVTRNPESEKTLAGQLILVTSQSGNADSVAVIKAAQNTAAKKTKLMFKFIWICFKVRTTRRRWAELESEFSQELGVVDVHVDVDHNKERCGLEKGCNHRDI